MGVVVAAMLHAAPADPARRNKSGAEWSGVERRFEEAAKKVPDV